MAVGSNLDGLITQRWFPIQWRKEESPIRPAWNLPFPAPESQERRVCIVHRARRQVRSAHSWPAFGWDPGKPPLPTERPVAIGGAARSSDFYKRFIWGSCGSQRPI